MPYHCHFHFVLVVYQKHYRYYEMNSSRKHYFLCAYFKLVLKILPQTEEMNLRDQSNFTYAFTCALHVADPPSFLLYNVFRET